MKEAAYTQYYSRLGQQRVDSSSKHEPTNKGVYRRKSWRKIHHVDGARENGFNCELWQEKENVSSKISETRTLCKSLTCEKFRVFVFFISFSLRRVRSFHDNGTRYWHTIAKYIQASLGGSIWSSPCHHE